MTFNDLPLDGPAIDLEVRSAPGWESVRHDRRARSVALPDGASLDLGAVGKAWASDRAARAAAERIGTGALVACGGDVAVAGPDRPDGWRVRVAESVDARVWQDVMMFDGGLATSGTESRTWRRGGETLHHILDPATGLPAASPWAMASVAAATCAGANAAATAAIVLGDAHHRWLAGQGPARAPRPPRQVGGHRRRVAGRALGGVMMIAATPSGPSPLWFATRGAGVMTLVCLTVVVILGISTSLRVQGRRTPRFVTAALHRNFGLFTLILLAVHIATSVLDPFAGSARPTR